MAPVEREIWIGDTPLQRETEAVTGSYVTLFDERYYRIAHYDQMPSFFMSLVSSSDHWLFIASSGGLTAGRINADSALFPYETEDKIAAHSEQSGGKTILRVRRGERTFLWEPFSARYAGVYRHERHLYKNVYGNKLIFEEINHDLQLTLRIAWRTGDRFGFIKSGWLTNHGDEACAIELLDGLQNVLPYGVTAVTQSAFSNLLHAYKRSELEPENGLGLFTLSATLSDRAEPSESLQATVAWQVGLDGMPYLLSTTQLDDFRAGRPLAPEVDVRGKAGAYFASASLSLAAQEAHAWHMVADVNQDSAAVTRLARFLAQEPAAITAAIEEDIARGTAELVRMVAAADGLQLTAEETTAAHHFANVLFNIMRGGIFSAGYEIEREDLRDFIRVRNHVVFANYEDWLAGLPARLPVEELLARAGATEEPDLIRLCTEYLPLMFSRRHGDPSRPWNRFSINLKKADGSPNLDYQGNWRDIFQNWEALAISYPDFVEGMVARFLNATTADGYNPYRVTRAGIEWEVPEPGNPWANIGYWSDHQIIYLQKLLELAEQAQPGLLAATWNKPRFAYADVPYRIRPYEAMLEDWTQTIDFDWQREAAIEEAVAELGTDGRLLRDAAGNVIHVTMIEKLLVLLLAKISNLVPEGGIWMNTQRPEWNDANNALVGKGLSVVTAAYLSRFVAFWLAQLDGVEETQFTVNTAVAGLFEAVQGVLAAYAPHLETGFDDRTRRAMMDDLGRSATAYRTALYDEGLPQDQAALSGGALRGLLTRAQAYLEQTLRHNQRPDKLYHAYNVLRLDGRGAAIENLYLMLEGQVAVLSSGLLTAEEALDVLYSLRLSDLYRADQHSYMLYPNRLLPGFRQKNQVTAAQVAGSQLVPALVEAGDVRLLLRDEAGVLHFNGRFRNAGDVAAVLAELAQEPAYAALAASERGFILDLFEETFNHRAFTGRSGTFFAYEGLGSIYWHMVAKLLLAVQENYLAARVNGTDPLTKAGLAAAYLEIRNGLGFNKSPAEYGAFPTDPYSHTPFGGGARQPGMTGQVKEEVLTRAGELGIVLRDGALQFTPALLCPNEFLPMASEFTYHDVGGVAQTLPVPARGIAFTVCQTPVIYTLGDEPRISVTYADGRTETREGSQLDADCSRHILARDGQVRLVEVTVRLSYLGTWDLVNLS